MAGPTPPGGRLVISRVLYFRHGDQLVGGVWVFDPAQPLQVEVRLHTRRRVVAWVFARQLLADAFVAAGPVGAGDVRVEVADGWLRLQLAPSSADCELWCWDDAVESFLWASYTLSAPRCPGCDSEACTSCAVVADELGRFLAGLGLDPGTDAAPRTGHEVGGRGGVVR